jgi:hypothetical protein
LAGEWFFVVLVICVLNDVSLQTCW